MKTKQNILILLLLLTSTLLSAQTPKWQWVKGGGSNGSDGNSGLKESCKWIGTDARGNIYGMSSIFNTGIHIDTSNVTNGFGYDDFAVFSYRCNGSFRWVRYFGSSTNDTPRGMFTDNEGNVFLVGNVAIGNFCNSHFGDSTILATSTMQKSAFVAKLDSNGHTSWLNIPGPAFPTSEDFFRFLSIKQDNQGNACALTHFYGNTNWGSYLISEKGYYVVKFDKNNGDVIGITKLDYNGSAGYSPMGMSFVIDTDNTYYLSTAVGFPDTLFVGSNILSCENDSVNIYTLTKFLSNGNLSWYKDLKGNFLAGQWKIIYGEPVIKGDYVYMNGASQNNVNFYGSIITNPYIYTPLLQTPLIARFRKDNGSFVSLSHVYNRVLTLFDAIAATSNGIVVSGSTGAGTSGNEIMMYNLSDTLKPGSTYNTAYPFILGIDTALTQFNWGIATRVNNANSKIATLTVDNADNIYAGGTFSDSIYNGFGTGIRSQGGPYDFFVAKISSNNNCSCMLATPFPQLVGINNNVVTVKGTAIGIVDSLYWHWGDGTTTKYLSQNTNVSHTYATGGNYTVCLRTHNNCGTKDSCMQVNGVGIEEQELKYLNAYPNPVNNTLTVENPYQCSMQLSIYQITGKLLFSKQYTNYSNTIDMSLYESGIYFVEVQLEDGRRAVRKVVKR